MHLWLPLLWLGCAGPAVTTPPAAPTAPPPPAAPSCPAAEPLIGAVEREPALWAARQLASVDVLALGEFHGLVPQIQLVSDVLAAASALPLDVDLGAELLPASRQGALDAMTSGEAFDEARWAEVVAGRPLLGPLAIADYLGPVRAAWTASRARKTRVIGLSPPCDFEAAHDADGAIACLEGREASMVALAEQQTLSAGRKMLWSAGFHHTSRISWPGSDVADPTAAARLAERHTLLSVLIAGPVAEREDGAWSRLCGGLLDAVGEAVGGPYAADLRQGPWAALGLDCLGPGAGTGALSTAFDAVIWVGAPEHAPPPTPLSPALLEAVGAPALRQWNRFEVELQGAPMGHLTQGADVWSGTARSEADRLARLKLAPVTACGAAANR